ncbi:MAG: YciI family protein [Candidatus Competibacterales bacterium]
MLYAIIARDWPDSTEKRPRARAAHLARLQTLQDQGRLLLAGPFPAVDGPDPGPAGFTGSLIVADFEDHRAAQAWAEADPYRSAGVYAEVDVRPFLRVLPP